MQKNLERRELSELSHPGDSGDSGTQLTIIVGVSGTGAGHGGVGGTGSPRGIDPASREMSSSSLFFSSRMAPGAGGAGRLVPPLGHSNAGLNGVLTISSKALFTREKSTIA